MDKCLITNLPINKIYSEGNVTWYDFKYEGKIFNIKLGLTFFNLTQERNFIENKYLLIGGILTNQLTKYSDGVYYFELTSDSFNEQIESIIYPKTPKEKLDNLFITIYKLQKYDGHVIEIFKYFEDETFRYKHFFKSPLECAYYIELLKRNDLIESLSSDKSSLEGAIIPTHCRLTYKGLNHFIEITESGKLSNKCFVAMSFGQKTNDIRVAIKDALAETGYIPIIIDEQHFESHKTINDAIIAELKQAKFCIADFTGQRRGVYFECGFALGQEKQVIYSCMEGYWWRLRHFDTDHFPHIKYKTPNELKEALINKINAWIK